MSDNAPALAVFAGQFHIFCSADLATLQALLARSPRCLVLVGSAHLARSIRNPFTWEERAAVIRQALPPADGERVVIQPLREWYDPGRTGQDVLHAAAGQLPQAGAGVLLVRSGEDLDFAMPDGWLTLDATDVPGEPEAVLRDRLLASDDPKAELNAFAPQLTAASVAFLGKWLGTAEHERLRQEWRQIASEKKAWSVAPYPVVLVTVDAVVRSGDHVLLIRRGRPPGQGLWALPGGFLDPAEGVLQAALRELVEETQIGLSEAQARAALRGVRVFDHPRRSQRGRIITHAHYFELAPKALPRVLGSDDAAHAEWIAIDQLPALESQFLDDHFLVLSHFLGLRPEG